MVIEEGHPEPINVRTEQEFNDIVQAMAEKDGVAPGVTLVVPVTVNHGEATLKYYTVRWYKEIPVIQ